jgi:hypothetical protein
MHRIRWVSVDKAAGRKRRSIGLASLLRRRRRREHERKDNEAGDKTYRRADENAQNEDAKLAQNSTQNALPIL